jgi:hypothetical protein
MVCLRAYFFFIILAPVCGFSVKFLDESNLDGSRLHSSIHLLLLFALKLGIILINLSYNDEARVKASFQPTSETFAKRGLSA